MAEKTSIIFPKEMSLIKERNTLMKYLNTLLFKIRKNGPNMKVEELRNTIDELVLGIQNLNEVYMKILKLIFRAVREMKTDIGDIKTDPS